MDVREDGHYRLPRPYIYPPPYPIPPPRPVPPPPPPQSYKIKELAVNATLQDQVAKVQLTQSFVNTGSRQMEVCFVFPLPYDGAIDRMTFMVDGKEFDAKLLDAKEARRDIRAVRPQQPGSGTHGVDGHGDVQDQCLSSSRRRRTYRHTPLQPGLPEAQRVDGAACSR